MNSFVVEHFSPRNVPVDRLREILYHLDGYMVPPLSSMVSIIDYAEKLAEKSEVFIARNDADDMGECAVYMNSADIAFVTSIGVKFDYQNLHVATALLQNAISAAKKKGLKFIHLKVSEENHTARNFYAKNDFNTIENDNGWLLMELCIEKCFNVSKNLSNQEKISIISNSPLFDKQWYSKKYFIPSFLASRHYRFIGYRIGCDPGPLFSSSYYSKKYCTVSAAGENPLLNYLIYGKTLLRTYRKDMDKIADTVLDKTSQPYIRLFDSLWYKNRYLSDGTNTDFHPLDHYNETGWKFGNEPSEFFIGTAYFQNHPLLKDENISPLTAYISGKCEYPPFDFHSSSYSVQLRPFPQDVFYALQNLNFNADPTINKSKKLVLFFLQPLDLISGGFIAIDSIAYFWRKTMESDGWDVAISTLPGPSTFSYFTKFSAINHVYRFSQFVENYQNLDEILLHIADNMSAEFYSQLSDKEIEWIHSAKNVRVNVLNQNIDLMPTKDQLNDLKKLTEHITQTTAHESYCTQENCNQFDMPLMRLGVFIKKKISPTIYSKKRNLLIYSPDKRPEKEAVLDTIRKSHPDLQLLEINNFSYDEYIKLCEEAKFSISFGEGMDGYFFETVAGGGVSFSVKNDSFFTEEQKAYPTVFDSYDDMIQNIGNAITKYDEETLYNKTNDLLLSSYNRVRITDKTLCENIVRFYEEKFDFYPQD